MKKLLALCISLLMLVSLLAACGEKGNESSGNENSNATPPSGEGSKSTEELLAERYEEPVVINIVLGYREAEEPNAPDDLTPETATAVKQFKELYNIELNYNWIVSNDQFAAKFGAELAAGNLPDIMYLDPNQFEDLYKQGAFADLSEAYELYANEDIEKIVNFDGELLDVGKREGKLYGLPMATYPAQSTSQTYYRMDLLKDYGIESYDDLPTTIADFEELCDKILADKGGPIMPANKYLIDAGLSDFSPVFHAYEAWIDKWVDDGSGSLTNTSVNENHKEALTKLNEWYEKGYFPVDFPAVDVWAASSPAVERVVAGDYPIVFGSWWIPNWPLNSNIGNEPDADWVVGPTLTKDGNEPTILVDRYPVNAFIAVSRDCKNPEAVFKMINWSLEFDKRTGTYDFEQTASEEELIEKYSHVYTWLPYRTHTPDSLVENFLFFNDLEKQGITTMDGIDANKLPSNSESVNALKYYLQYHENDANKKDPAIWGFYTSRIMENGGVAKMYELYTTSDIIYNERYVVTPTIVSNQSQLDDLTNNTFTSMIIGETPIEEFDKFVDQWKALGGEQISKEVNEWFATTK